MRPPFSFYILIFAVTYVVWYIYSLTELFDFTAGFQKNLQKSQVSFLWDVFVELAMNL